VLSGNNRPFRFRITVSDHRLLLKFMLFDHPGMRFHPTLRNYVAACF